MNYLKEVIMLEKEVERTSKPKKVPDFYAAMAEHQRKFAAARRQGKVLVKFRESNWLQNKQGKLNYISGLLNHDEMAAPNWSLLHNLITKRSGKHIHQGGIPIFVVQGKGHSIVDGVKHAWNKGSLIVLPIKPGGVEHQHFNEVEGGPPARWIAFRYLPIVDLIGNVRTQVEDSPDWSGEE